MKQIILYGIAGASQQFITQMYYCLYEEDISIGNIVYQAKMMKAKCPSIEHVYAIDNRRGLRREYKDSIRLHTIESCYIFKDTLEREEFKII